jgi:hypothetical protein
MTSPTQWQPGIPPDLLPEAVVASPPFPPQVRATSSSTGPYNPPDAAISGLYSAQPVTPSLDGAHFSQTPDSFTVQGSAASNIAVQNGFVSQQAISWVDAAASEIVTSTTDTSGNAT